MSDEARTELFRRLSESGAIVGTQDVFNQKMDSPNARKALFEQLSSRGDISGDFDVFERKMSPIPTKGGVTKLGEAIKGGYNAVRDALKPVGKTDITLQPPEQVYIDVDKLITTLPSIQDNLAYEPVLAHLPSEDRNALGVEMDKALSYMLDYYKQTFSGDINAATAARANMMKVIEGNADDITLKTFIPKLAVNAYKNLVEVTTIPADVSYQYLQNVNETMRGSPSDVASAVLKTTGEVIGGVAGFVVEEANRVVEASGALLPLYVLTYGDANVALQKQRERQLELFKRPLNPYFALHITRGVLKTAKGIARAGGKLGVSEVALPEGMGYKPVIRYDVPLRKGIWEVPIPKQYVEPQLALEPLKALKTKGFKFEGMQEGADGRNLPLFTITEKGHPSYGSTLSPAGMRKAGFQTPSIEELTRMQPGVVTQRVSYTPTPIPKEYREKLITTLKEAKKVRPEVLEEKGLELSRRVGGIEPTIAHLRKKGVPSEKAIIASTGKLKGPLTEYTQRFEPIRGKVSDKVLESYFKTIAEHPELRPLEKISSQVSLTKLVDGSYMTLGDVRNIWKAFNETAPELGKAAMRHVPIGERSWRIFQEAINLPYTTLTNIWDMSGLTRQGRFLMQRYPELAPTFISKYAQSFASERLTKDIVRGYRSSPNYNRAIRLGLQITEEPSLAMPLGMLEERFLGAPLLERVPIVGKYVVKPTARSFTSSLNWYRMSIVDRIIGAADATGRPLTDVKLKRLISDINDMSGRSALKGSAIQHAAPFINALFAPRFAISRAKLIGKAFYRPGVAATWASMIGTNMAIMALVKAAGGDDVEVEPDLRSSDGGKVKIGNTRFDLWAGQLPYVRTLVRLATGETKSVAGHIYPLDYKAEIFNVLRSRTNPLYSLVVDAITGQTYIGERFGAPPRGVVGDWMTSKGIPEWVQSTSKEVWDRMGPLTMQDVTDALIYEGVPMAITVGMAGFIGVSVQTYPESIGTTVTKLKDQLAQQQLHKNWDDIGPGAQEAIRKSEPDLAELEQQQKYERSLGPEERTYRVEPLPGIDQETKQVLKGLYIPVPAVSRKISTNWVLNDERYKEYQDLTALYINSTIRDMVSEEYWNKSTNRQKRESVEACIEIIKEIMRNKIQNEADIKDLQLLEQKGE